MPPSGSARSSGVHKITDVKALENYKMEITFAGGNRGIMDLSHLVGKVVVRVVVTEYPLPRLQGRIRVGGDPSTAPSCKGRGDLSI
jgi:hypothetical protein